MDSQLPLTYTNNIFDIKHHNFSDDWPAFFHELRYEMRPTALLILVVEAAALGAANQDVHFPMSVEMEEEDKDSFRSNIRGKTTIPRGEFLDRFTHWGH